MIAVIMTVPTVLVIFASFFVPAAVKKFGKRNVLMGTVFAQSIGLLVVYFAPFGYVANQQQTVKAMEGINIVVNLIPAILYILAGLCCLLWKISDKDADEIRAKLKERNEK